jgi:DNA-binding beta-propeller fold protein YncE/uncharacterized membrane protein
LAVAASRTDRPPGRSPIDEETVMSRRIVTTALAAGLVLATTVLPAAGQEAPPTAGERACPDGATDAGFEDVSDGNVHAAAIDCAASFDIVRGVTATRFVPDRSVTRGQIASLLARTLDAAEVDLPSADGAPDLSDLDPTSADDVRRLAAADIVEGRPDGSYRPSHPITREALASLLVRTLSFVRGVEVEPSERGVFPDVADGPHAANVDAAFEQRLLFGRADGTFAPRAATRRDQSATVVVRLLDRILEDRDTATTAGGEVWVLDQGTDLIHVYDGDDGFAELATIDVRPSTLRADGFTVPGSPAATVPHMIEFDSQDRYAFIASTAGGVTLVVDARTKEIVEVLGTGPGSHMAAVTPDDSAAWVAVIGTAGRSDTQPDGTTPAADRKMVEIPLELDAADPTFEIGRELHVEDLVAPIEAEDGWTYPSFSPVCHQYSTDSTEAWITLGPGGNQGGLLVLDLESGELAAGYDPEEIKANCGVSVTDEQVVVNWSGVVDADDPTNDTDGEWYVFDPDTHEQVGEARDAEGLDAHGIRLTPDGQSYWMVNRGSDNALVVDADTLEVTRRITDVADTPDIIDYSPDGSLVYITQRGPAPRSGAIHSATGQQPGLAVVDEATGETVTVLEQPTIVSPAGTVLNDVHGVGVRTPTADEEVAEATGAEATVAEPTVTPASAVTVDRERPEPEAGGFHCTLLTS